MSIFQMYIFPIIGGDFIKFDFEKANSECRSCQMSFEASDIASQYREFYLKILSS